MLIAPLLAPDRIGRPGGTGVQVVNGILQKLSPGADWRDLPERYGPWKTVCERFPAVGATVLWWPAGRVRGHDLTDVAKETGLIWRMVRTWQWMDPPHRLPNGRSKVRVIDESGPLGELMRREEIFRRHLIW